MARLAVDGRTFNGTWQYWLPVGGLVMPVTVVLASLPVGVRPRLRAVLACAATSLLGTVLAGVLLHASREPATLTFLGGFCVALLATGTFVLATSAGEVARRDALDP
jgi:hypothetical protein